MTLFPDVAWPQGCDPSGRSTRTADVDECAVSTRTPLSRRNLRFLAAPSAMAVCTAWYISPSMRKMTTVVFGLIAPPSPATTAVPPAPPAPALPPLEDPAGPPPVALP